MNTVLFAFCVLGGLGVLFGLVLAIASKVFHVDEDPRIAQVTECLNGANCGACGYAGCSGYAEAIVKGEAKIGLCAPAGAEGAAKISAIMGQAPGEFVRQVAFVKCSGGSHAHLKYTYNGVKDCALASSSIGGGPLMCVSGCLGFGNCIKACRFGAISIVDGVAKVDHEKCRGCGACAEVCPKKLITVIPYRAAATVACNNTDKGGITRKVCESGCLGCHICEKICPHNAVHIIDNLSVKDFSKCLRCGVCAEKCPRKLIYFPDVLMEQAKKVKEADALEAKKAAEAKAAAEAAKKAVEEKKTAGEAEKPKA